MNGFDFLVQIKKENALSKIPVGIFTTSNIIRDGKLTKELGARFFVIKPINFQIICKKLQQILISDSS